jgi:hypothetical protein
MTVRIARGVVVLLLACSAGCKKEVKEITLTPSVVETLDKGANDQVSYACIPGDCFHTHGTSCSISEPDAVRVGYSYTYKPGTKPCACWWWVDCVWRGAIAFDLGPLQGKKVVSAELFYSQSNQKQSGSTATNAESCVAKLLIAKGSPGFNTPGDALTGAPTSGINISSTVRDWVDGIEPNHGLLFIGFDEGTPAKEDRECVSRLSKMTLLVRFTE